MYEKYKKKKKKQRKKKKKKRGNKHLINALKCKILYKNPENLQYCLFYR